MFDWFNNTFKTLLGGNKTTDTIGGGVAVQSIPWYIPVTLVIIGGVLVYKLGAKVLKL